MLHDIFVMTGGAALVSLGVLSAGLADRIRGLKLERRIAATPRVIQVDADPAPAPRARAPKIVKPEPSPEQAERVIRLLMNNGYKKSVATAAVCACSEDERGSVSAWTRAALHRASQNAAVSS